MPTKVTSRVVYLVNLLSQSQSNNISASRPFSQLLQFSGFVKFLLVDLIIVRERITLLSHMPLLFCFQLELFKLRHDFDPHYHLSGLPQSSKQSDLK